MRWRRASAGRAPATQRPRPSCRQRRQHPEAVPMARGGYQRPTGAIACVPLRYPGCLAKAQWCRPPALAAHQLPAAMRLGPSCACLARRWQHQATVTRSSGAQCPASMLPLRPRTPHRVRRAGPTWSCSTPHRPARWPLDPSAPGERLLRQQAAPREPRERYPACLPGVALALAPRGWCPAELGRIRRSCRGSHCWAAEPQVGGYHPQGRRRQRLGSCPLSEGLVGRAREQRDQGSRRVGSTTGTAQRANSC